MAGAAAAGELSAGARAGGVGAAEDRRVRFAVAGQEDEAALRRLLRENPMRGRIALGFEREPDFFAGASDDEITIVARERGRVVCLGRCASQRRFIGGEPRHVAYLGELRLDAAARARVGVVRDGYQFFRHVPREATPEAMFTSIAADNHPAIRLLERGLPGMPRYRFLTEFVTVVVAVPARRARGEPPARASARDAVDAGELIPFLATAASRHDLALAWTREVLEHLVRLNLAVDDFRVVRDAGRIVAAGALWDQRRFRQTVIRRYDRSLALVRPILNAVACVSGGPGLPPVGSALALAHVSPLACAPGGEAAAAEVVRALFSSARVAGVELLSAGFAAHDPALDCLRRAFRLREYRSRLYQVDWPDEPATWLIGSDALRPEVALL